MSVKLTTQMNWLHYARYSKFHPDNMNRKPDTSLPDPVKGPEPVAKMTEIDKARGMWGHQLSSECSLGGAPVDSSDRVKTNAITPKVGSSWNLQFEQNGSKMKSGVYSTTLRVVSMEEQVELAGGKSPFL